MTDAGRRGVGRAKPGSGEPSERLPAQADRHKVGTIELAIPKLRRGSHFQDWLFDPRGRAEKALVTVAAECSVHGGSTQRVDGLVRTLGIESLSKSHVSWMSAELNEIVSEFRIRPLDDSPY